MIDKRKLVHFQLHIFLIIGLFVQGCSKRNERIVIAFSNDTMGQIRSCGCVRKDLGGLGRRATFVRMVRDTTAGFLLVDGGDFFSSKINYGREKADLTIKAMSLMGYDGVVPGERDLSFGLDYLKKRSQFNNVPMLLANVFDSRTDSLIFSPRRIVTLANGIKVAVIGVMDNTLSLPAPVKRKSIRLLSPGKALEEQISQVGGEADLVVVLAHMPVGKAIQLPKKISGIDVIVCGHEGKPMKKVIKYYGTYILQIAKEGRFMGLASAVLNKNKKIEKVFYRAIPLSTFYTEDEAISKLFKAYDMDITVKEKAHLSRRELRSKIEKPFAEASSCKKCHNKIFSSWQETKHAHAFKVLKDQGREYDRDCTPCHTTGFYESGGYENIGATPQLTNVQCEACHGNGHDHISNPEKKMKRGSRSTCKTCHNDVQSPDFSFEAYWPKIAHGREKASSDAKNRH